MQTERQVENSESEREREREREGERERKREGRERGERERARGEREKACEDDASTPVALTRDGFLEVMKTRKMRRSMPQTDVSRLMSLMTSTARKTSTADTMAA